MRSDIIDIMQDKRPKYTTDLCRKLRADQTPTEAKLWEALRNRGLNGHKFRRQHPIGRYVADFYCPEAGLVIELDGEAHSVHDQAEYDKIRDTELKGRDLKVIRIKNDEAELDLSKVLERIRILVEGK